MIGLAISLLTSRIAGPLASAVAVVAMVLAVSQCSGRVGAERKLERSEKARVAAVSDLRTCQANVTGLTVAVDRQNEAVDAIRRESEAKVAEGRKAVSAARSAAEGYRKEAARIMGAKPKGDACEAADALVLEAVQ